MLLIGLLLAGAITIFVQADSYGISMDEPLQDRYGHAVMEWYHTLGKDSSFLQFPNAVHMPEHGGIFDAAIAVVQHEFAPGEHWHVRRIMTALAGLLGLIAIALCGYELGGYWVAFLAALALWLYPRYYGAIYNNPKDIPAAVTTTFLLWAVLLLIKQWGEKRRSIRNSVLVGFSLGLATAIRVNAVIWYLILTLLLIAWWLCQGKHAWREKRVRAEFIRQGRAAALIGIASFLTMIALWPYIFLNPLKNLYLSIIVMSHYPWNGSVLYHGQRILATQLPRTYALEWLFIGSPLVLVLFALLGLSVVCISACKTRSIDPKLALVISSFVIPLGAIIVLHAVLYDALRQILFLIPPIILLAAYGFVRMVAFLGHRKQKALRWVAGGLALITLFSYVLLGTEMIHLSPFEYTYFSPVIGGLPGAEGKFDTDYWATCSEPAMKWLAQYYQQYTTLPDPSVEDAFALITPTSVGPLFWPSALRWADNNPTFYIGSTRDNLAQKFPTYRIIHTIGAEGVPFCVIKVNPAFQRR